MGRIVQQIFNANGTWIAPAGVTQVWLFGCGGGGGGGACFASTNVPSGAGGGGSIWCNALVGVIPGRGYSVTIGAGGAGQISGNDGNPGNPTSFKDNVTTNVLAQFNGASGGGGTSNNSGGLMAGGGQCCVYSSNAFNLGSLFNLVYRTSGYSSANLGNSGLSFDNVAGGGAAQLAQSIGDWALAGRNVFGGFEAGIIGSFPGGLLDSAGPAGGGGAGPLGIGGAGGASNSGSPGIGGSNGGANTGAGGGGGGTGTSGGAGGNGGSGVLYVCWFEPRAWETQTFLNNGKWLCPAGVSSVLLTGYGGGGGGGGGAIASGATVRQGGGGGGAAQLCQQWVSVVPNTSYAVTIGVGGVGGTGAASPGGNGGNTTFGSLATFWGASGAGSPAATTSNMGPGGLPALSGWNAFASGGSNELALAISYQSGPNVVNTSSGVIVSPGAGGASVPTTGAAYPAAWSFQGSQMPGLQGIKSSGSQGGGGGASGPGGGGGAGSNGQAGGGSSAGANTGAGGGGSGASSSASPAGSGGSGQLTVGWPIPQQLSVQQLTQSGNWICPPGVTSVILFGYGGGGGGSSGAASSSINHGGGGGGSWLSATVVSVVPGTEYAVTIGAGGAGGAAISTGNTNSNPGVAGGDTTFGSLANFSGASGGQPITSITTSYTGGGLPCKLYGGANAYASVWNHQSLPSSPGVFAIYYPGGGGGGVPDGFSVAFAGSGNFQGTATPADSNTGNTSGGGSGGTGPGGAGGRGVAGGASTGTNAAANTGAGGSGGNGGSTSAGAGGNGGSGSLWILY